MTQPDQGHNHRLSEALNEAQAHGRYFRQEQAALTRRASDLRRGVSDVAGSGYAARRDKLVGLTVVCLLFYAIIVGYLIAGLNLPVGWTWLVAAVLIFLIFLITRLIRMRRIRGRFLPR